jgi:Recombination endonuclease VII
MKTCVYCKIEKDIVEFPKHSLYKDNLDMRCRDCIKKHVKIRKELHKNAPPKPEFCECCGEIPRKWCLDHDHKTDKFRGWLCDKCNTGIGKLGDDLEGVMKAVKFLKNVPIAQLDRAKNF